MITAIIFDCFGVLVGRGYGHTYAVAGGDPVKDGDFIEATLERANAGRMTSVEFDTAMAEHLAIPLERYRQVVAREEQPNEQLFDYIRTKLKPSYKIAPLSNVNHGVIERKLSPKQRQLFDVEILSADVGAQKPDPHIYALTIQKLAVSYENAVFIDDLQKYLDPAAALGMQTILYRDFDQLQSKLVAILAS